MNARIDKENLLNILAGRENYGCHPDLGMAGNLIRFGKTRAGGKQVFRAGIKLQDQEAVVCNIAPGDLNARGLSRTAKFITIGSPVFYFRPGTPYARNGCLFLDKPEEVLLMLRINLQFLRKRNDGESKRLCKELTGICSSDVPATKELCESLVALKGSSSKDFLAVLDSVEDRKVAVEAADRGEIISVLGDCGEVAERLDDSNTLMLRNVVRSHYFGKMADMLKDGAKLSPLGNKIFKGGKEVEFNVGERQALLLLSICVADKRGPMAAIRASGQFLLGKKK
ncbi:MAG: hypothetical protein ACYTGH_15490 [Planctomycetota bacterium]|jgi:hypothetical protein